MQAFFIVLNHQKHLYNLIKEFKANGIYGGTILDSQGLANITETHFSESRLGYTGILLNEGRPYNKTIFLLIEDDKIELIKECVRKVTGGMQKENQGIMFALPVSFVEGLTK